MKGKKVCTYVSGCLILFCILFSQSCLFVTANNQGFVWGLEAGTRLDYRQIHTEESESGTRILMDEEMYIITDDLPEIPDDIDSIGVFTPYSVQGSAYWINGSDYPYVIGSISNFQVFPVGNWPLLTSIFNEYREIFQDSEIWGMRASGDSEDLYQEIDNQFLKEDGAMAYYYIEVYNKTSNFRESMEITREGYTKRTPALVEPIVWAAIILGIVGLSVVTLLIRRRRTA